MLRHEQHVVERQCRGQAERGVGEQWGSGRRQIHGLLLMRKRPTDVGLSSHAAAPWHFLYFFPLPHGHGSFLPTFGSSRRTVLTTSSPPVRAGAGACATAAADRDA